MASFDNLQIGKNDRAILIGATGCGKTTLAKYIIEDKNKPHSVVYDPKISDNIGNWGHTYYENLEELQNERKAKRLIFRPTIYEAASEVEQEKFFEWVYTRKHTRLYVDEAYALLGGSNPSFYLQAILSRGRERGISCVVATQRPKRIPLITISEAEHFFIFRLNLLEDRLRVQELTGFDAVDQTNLRNYEFHYYNGLTGQLSNKLKLNL